MGILQLNRNENNMEFTDLDKTILAGQDEEVWMEIFTYKDSKHKEEVRAKMMNDESCGKGYQQFFRSHYSWIQCHPWGFQ